MKKHVRISLVLLFLLILFHFFHLFLYRGRIVNYVIKDKNKYEVHEEYIRNQKEVSNHYYVEITFDKVIFNFRIFDDFSKKSYIIDNVYSFKNEQYMCILPIFIDGSIRTDILCQKEGTIYPYRKLQNESLELDQFATSMEEYGYRVNTKKEVISNYGVDIMKNNIQPSHTIVLPSYKGIYLINGKDKNVISSIDLFKKDIYTQAIQSVVSNYYVVADYDLSYSFHKFKLVDLNTKKISSIVSDSAISMDSYIQGVVSDCFYLLDRSNRKQYKIDVSSKLVTLIGNSKKGILYYNGSDFETKSIYEALNQDLLFESISKESSKYDYVYALDGVHYSYLKTRSGYDVYLSYEENSDLYTYGFSVSSIDKVKYIGDFVYYIDKDTIYCYHPKTGAVDVLTYAELVYNSKLDFWVYKK